MTGPDGVDTLKNVELVKFGAAAAMSIATALTTYPAPAEDSSGQRRRLVLVQQLLQLGFGRWWRGGSIWTVKEVRPAFGSTAGGTRILVLGWGFTGATSVTVGGVTAPEFKFINDATIEIVTPPGALGWQELRVWVPNGSVPAAFQYVAPTAATPAAAAAARPPRQQRSRPSAGKPAKTIGAAPSVAAKVGQVVSVKVKGLPKSALVSARVKVDGKWVALGKVRASKVGAATLPSFLASKAGTYPIEITGKGGYKSFVKVVVS